MACSGSTSLRVHAVLFDYGLVLSGPQDPAAWERLKAVFGADEARFHEAYWKHRLDYDRGAFIGTTYWPAVAAELGATLDDAQLAELLATDTDLWARPNQPMIDWAAALQRAGVKTGVLSNIGDAMEEGLLARHAWLGDFAHHTFSHRLRMAKPDAAIYECAAEGLGVPAEEVLFIDDREENVDGAKAAGMKAIRYTDHASFERAMRDEGFGSLLETDS